MPEEIKQPDPLDEKLDEAFLAICAVRLGVLNQLKKKLDQNTWTIAELDSIARVLGIIELPFVS